MSRRSLRNFLAAALLALALPAGADTVRVAVASNFGATLKQLAPLFESESGHRLAISTGSTGKLYAQVVNGAPFDVLLAADRERPERLERDGHAVAGTRFTYATGQLVLWRPKAETMVDGLAFLATEADGLLAIANPELAPYGLAAKQALQHQSLWETVSPRLVIGENIAQAWLFTSSGNASAGIVAEAQLKANPGAGGGAWRIPADWHDPIEQQAVLLRDSGAARDFLAFLKSDTARSLIVDSGYAVLADDE